MEKEISKKEFKRLYFKYGDETSGWTKDYWAKFFEKEEGKKYFFSEPNSPKETRMLISSDTKSHRIFFLTEEAEDSFFDNQSE